ncbi:hypothetical protein [Ruminococcus sp. YE282]|uniref:hypothetical protein n=1 Tax=Ruminococcus sp. YE282 TaxID=3158780 RepID=UPI00088CCE5C|nr:hypothetical protein SAMN02910441_01938 [Ruminococcus bromii]
MSKYFREKSKLLTERLDILYNLLERLKEQIILEDLSNELGTQIKAGRQQIDGFNWIDEIDVSGELFTLINKTKNKYYAYVIYTKKDYHTVGLGFLYKNEVIAPHMDFEVENIIKKYSNVELDEISNLIDELINKINQDIDYLNANSDPKKHEHYYGEYNKGFDSKYRYESIVSVFNDYEKR